MIKKIFEEYVESPDYKVSVFFKELEAQINDWFEDGSFGKQGNELGQIQTSLTINAMEKYLLFDFSSPENYYQVIFIVRLDDMQGEPQAQGQGTLGETGDQAPAPAQTQPAQTAPPPAPQTAPPQERYIWKGSKKLFEQDDMGGGDAPAPAPAPTKKNADVKKVLLKIKKYSDIEKQKLIKELVEEISVEDIKEDFIIEKISQLDTQVKEPGETDLKDKIHEE